MNQTLKQRMGRGGPGVATAVLWALCSLAPWGRAAAEEPKVVHAPYAAQMCDSCHEMNGGNIGGLLAPQPELCYQCHEAVDTGKVKHGALAIDSCTTCHHPHESAFPKLLKAAYPVKNYAEFKVENYALCFGCHDEKKILVKDATATTGFKDLAKKRNLHHLHVLREPSQYQRSCRFCHDPHSTGQEHLLRDKFPFGSSAVGLAYTPQVSGGSCAKTCHKEVGYVNR